MKIAEAMFRGEQPRVGATKLGGGLAQIASCCRLLSGNLEAWHDYGLEWEPSKYGEVNSIHLMDGQFWLVWLTSELGAGQAAVDVVLGAVPGDVTERTYFTGTDAPRVTNIEMATGGSGTDYPQDSILLGVPAPTDAPTLTVEPPSTDTNSINIVNPGAESGNTTGWTSTTGTLAVHANGDVVGQSADTGTHYFYGSTDASVVAYQRIDLGAEGVIVNQKLTLTWKQSTGVNLSTGAMRIRFRSGALVDIGVVSATDQVSGAAHAWVLRTLDAVIPADAAYADLEILMTRVGAAENDCYIDTITADATTSALNFDCSSLTGWNVTPYATDGSTYEQGVVVDAGSGQPAPSFQILNDSRQSFIWRDFALDQAPSALIEFDAFVRYDVAIALGTNKSGAFDTDAHYLVINALGVSQYLNSSNVHSYVSRNMTGEWLRVSISFARIDAQTVRVTTTITTKGTGIKWVDAAVEDFSTTGKFLQLFCSGPDTSVNQCNLDNILVKVDPPNVADETTFVSYVFVWVNEFGDISAPSPASSTVQRGPNSPVIVTTSTSPPTGYGIVSKRIYRAVTSDTGTAFQLVNTEGDIDPSYADYDDEKADSDLGEVLESDGWDLPPTDGHNIVAGPNGITFIASKNTVCPSVAFKPHAYPQDWRLSTDFPVVSMGILDTNLVVTTTGPAYIVTGDDPSKLSMTKLELPQGNQCRRSGAYLRGVGYIYGGPDGLIAVAAIGQMAIATEDWLSPREWKLLHPETLIGIAHDDRYFGFYDAGEGQKFGFIFDPKPNGMGFVQLDFHSQACYVDIETDRLFIVVDDLIYQWDKDGEYFRPYQWKSKRYLMPKATVFRAAKIRAADYDDLTLKLYANGTEFHSRAVTSKDEFRIPAPSSNGAAYDDFEFQLSGTSAVQVIQIAESMQEIDI